jgi:peptidoglycan/xylan/chitin deacetylase (PgdA/CDA1 family)
MRGLREESGPVGDAFLCPQTVSEEIGLTSTFIRPPLRPAMYRLKLALLFLFRTIGLFRLSWQLTRGELRILCYHGFALDDEACFRPKLFIGQQTFQKRLETLRRYGCHVIALDPAIDQLYGNELAPHSTVITVDDGYHSFHSLAVPLLNRYGYAATVYVTTYYVRHPNPVFRLAVQYMFWKAAKRKVTLEGFEWSSQSVVDLNDAQQAQKAEDECIDFGETKCTEEQRVEICRRLGDVLDVSYTRIVRSKILHLMSPEELRSLENANVTVELHTHRHIFPENDRAVAEREIAERIMLSSCSSVSAARGCTSATRAVSGNSGSGLGWTISA